MTKEDFPIKSWTRIILILSVLLAVLNGVNPGPLLGLGL